MLWSHIFCKQGMKNEAAGLGQQQRSRQKEKSWASVSIQFTYLPLAGYSLLTEPACVQLSAYVQLFWTSRLV